MPKETGQTKVWSGSFGRDYTDRSVFSPEEMDALYRNLYGITRTEMNTEAIGALPRDIRILEVGANVGNQLLCLQKMGFTDLTSIELQEYAVALAKERTRSIKILQGSAFDIPFKDASFDLVFTSGVLIHISPEDIATAQKEIHRCARKYIWGFEYFADRYTQIPYRGNKDLLWKTDFAKNYLDRYTDLQLVFERRFKHAGSENIDSMFLLEKA